jgi:hypothetical protein
MALTRAEAEAIVIQTAGYPQHDETARAALRAAAERKHEREAEDFRAFALIDQAAYAERIGASVTSAADGLEAAREAEAEAERKAAEALRAERRAEDRAREHAVHARKLQHAWERVKGRGTPQKQTDAFRDGQAAAQVAQGEQAAAEGKAAARTLADRELEAARARISEAEDALRAAHDLADCPGRALYSPQTCAENIVHMVQIWDTLQPMEQQLARNAISMLAMLTGLYDEIKAEGAVEREAELEGHAPQPGPAFGLGPALAGAAGR